MEANLIVTYDPNHQGKAQEEINGLLPSADFLESEFPGVFLLHASNPKDIVRNLNELCGSEPYKFRYTFRWVPVDKWCKTDIAEIEKLLKEIDGKIDPKESWKMDIEKRGFEADAQQLI
ncbi:MAG: hypothetical protein NT120_02625, partial [Candidatus Aenigmarchaeota archaeon]|nr:hypothetical protein [Candidatus Aenigmarchaeota archaeon]